jgi:hypothetical protein
VSETQTEASQTCVWERVRFEDAFSEVFSTILRPDEVYNIYLELQKHLFSGSEPIIRSTAEFDIVFSLARHVLEKIGGLDEAKEIWKAYAEGLKTYIKAVYMLYNGEKVSYIASEIESAAGLLAGAIESAIEELAAKRCEDPEDP